MSLFRSLPQRSVTLDTVLSTQPAILIRKPESTALHTGLNRAVLRLISVVTPLLLLGIWEITADAHLIDVRFFPAPSTIAHAFVTLWQGGQLWENTRISLLRILYGFLWGAIPGIILGLLMGILPPFRAALQLIVDATFPIPNGISGAAWS
jgi:ABC-type nitrate/sulfonate/bicarbonate transport system permease component